MTLDDDVDCGATDGQISAWIDGLQGADDEAMQGIWHAYFERLVALARHRLSSLPRREMDEEDVALSALHSFHRGAQANRFSKLENRHDLWKILATITLRKAMRQRRRFLAQKRGGGRIRGESVFQPQSPEVEAAAGIDQFLASGPTPDIAAMFAERCGVLFAQLDDLLKDIALLKTEGFTSLEISEKLNLSLRTVERRLERIRAIWSASMSQDLDPD